MSLVTQAVESSVANGSGLAVLEEINRAPRVSVQPAPNPASQAPAISCPPGWLIFKVGHRLEDVEREMILKTMEMTRGNRTRAAKMLGISVRTLYTKLLEIDKENALRAATPTAILPKI